MLAELRCKAVSFGLCRNLLCLRRYSKLGPTDLKGRKTAAQKWLLRQSRDPYAKLARRESYRCRSAYKLIEIDEEFDILKPGHLVLDCGSAPGSWSQVAVERVNATGTMIGQPTGHVISVDLQSMSGLDGTTVLDNCDITLAATQQSIRELLGGRPLDVILSDMAPAASGVKSLDHDCIVQLAMAVLRLSVTLLREQKQKEPGGTLLVKLWQGGQTDSVFKAMQKCFANIRLVKPLASRSDSAEIYMLARQFTLART